MPSAVGDKQQHGYPFLSEIGRFRHRLSSGEVCIGPSITFTDPTVTEALCDSSDFVWIDTEHNPMNLETVTTHLIAARACGTAALVRVPTSETAYIKRVLDSGGGGVVVPQIRSADEVRRVVEDCRYPPLGSRGFGPRRPSNYARFTGDEYIQSMNENVFVSVQIENLDALHALDEIVTITGLDSIVIGPMDLSASMGLIGQISHPKVVKAIESIISSTLNAGLFVGIGLGMDLKLARYWAQQGVQFIQLGCDFEYLTKQFDALRDGVRGC